jgi:hypothetical protein
MDTGDSRVSDDAGSLVFMRFLLLHTDQIDGILIACFRLRCLISTGLIPRR